MNQQIKLARTILERKVIQGETLSYREFAIKLGIQQAPVIAQVTCLLEQMIEEDAANQSPVLAAMVVQKKGDVPRPGFFEKIYQVGFSSNILSGEEAVVWHQQELKKLREWVGK